MNTINGLPNTAPVEGITALPFVTWWENQRRHYSLNKRIDLVEGATHERMILPG